MTYVHKNNLENNDISNSFQPDVITSSYLEIPELNVVSPNVLQNYHTCISLLKVKNEALN